MAISFVQMQIIQIIRDKKNDISFVRVSQNYKSYISASLTITFIVYKYVLICILRIYECFSKY